MKKILLLSFLIFAGSQLHAQQISGYYDYGYSLFLEDSINGTPSPFYYFLIFPDSTVKQAANNGSAIAVQDQSDGQVFDPTDYNFNINNYVLTPYMSYTVDSIFVEYNYKRFQLAAPDTLLVQIYDNSAITFNPTPGFPNHASYATVEYNYLIREGSNPIYSEKILLTDTDNSPNDSLEYLLSIPLNNISVPAGKKIAATFTYFPGNAYAIGDTIDPFLSPHKLVNSLKFFYYGSDIITPLYYNNELTVDPSVRYNINTNGWNGEYIPGTAFADTVYNLDMLWHITFDSALLSVQNISLVTNAAIYPNPAGNSNIANLVFSLVNDNDLTIDITNDIGVKILSYNKQHFRSGINHVEINTTYLPAGIYICNINGAQGKQSLKLAIQ